MSPDRPATGVLLMLGFCVVAPLGDGIAKILGETVPLVQLLLVRFAAQVILLLPFALILRTALLWSPGISAFVALRTVLHIAGIGLMFLSLRYLPLAEAVAIAFVMPFVLLILGHLLLREEVGWRRIAACALGFAGTLCVVQPQFAEVGAPALIPLGVAVIFALFMLVTRRVARATDPIALQATSGVIATALILPLLLMGGGTLPDLAVVRPSGTEIGLMTALGVLGSLGHLLMTWSLRFAPASTLAPMQYLEIPVAALVGWVLFRDFPNGLALFGIAITVAAGLYIITRERRLAAGPAPTSPPPAPPAA